MKRDSAGKQEKQQFQIKEGIPIPIGVYRTKRGVNLSVCIPSGKTCRLLIYRKGNPVPCRTVSTKEGRRIGNVWALEFLDFDEKAYEYNLEIDGVVAPAPYARRVIGREQFGFLKDPEKKPFVRCGFASPDYDWEGDRPLQIPSDQICGYSLHVRGFTRHASSKVRHKGTFLGIVEKLPYLCDLGINQIELMPAYEFDECRIEAPYNQASPRLNYWGYGPACFFSPKASYSAGEDPCREFKDMVKACHKAGVEVIMEFYFPEKTNGHLILDCIRYWAMVYHVDGFHINSGGIPVEELVTDPILSGTKFYSADSAGLACGGQREKVAVYQEDFQQAARRILKSDEDQLGRFTRCLTNQPEKTGIINYITGHNGFTLLDLVSYDQKHNEANGEDNRDGSNYNLSWNCGEEGKTRKKKVMALRRRQMKNALSMLYLSQGIPMLLAGDEMGNSQEGNNNAYCLDNEISWVQWNRPPYKEIGEFVKKLIAIRREHPILHRQEGLRMMDVTGCGYPDLSYHSEKAWYSEMDYYSRHIGVMYCDGKKSEEGKISRDFLYAAFNFHWLEHSFALPNLPQNMKWCLLFSTGAPEEENCVQADPAKILRDQRQLTVEGRTVALLTGVLTDE